MNHGEWFTDTIEWMKGMLNHPSKYDSEFQDSDPLEVGTEPGKDDLTETDKSNIILDDENAENDLDGDSIR